jgi:hypothetical protein
MAEYELAVLVLDVLVEPDAGADFDQDRGERGLVDLEAARGAAGQQPPLPVPAGSPPVRFPGFEGYRRLMTTGRGLQLKNEEPRKCGALYAYA